MTEKQKKESILLALKDDLLSMHGEIMTSPLCLTITELMLEIQDLKDRIIELEHQNNSKP